MPVHWTQQQEFVPIGEALGAVASVTWTVTFIKTYKGLPEKLSILWPGAVAGRGVVTVATTFRPLPNGELESVSQTFFGEHGPHPDVESGCELFGEVLVPGCWFRR